MYVNLLEVSIFDAHRFQGIRLYLAPLILGNAIIIFGYSGTLISFLTVKHNPQPMNRIKGPRKTNLTKTKTTIYLAEQAIQILTLYCNIYVEGQKSTRQNV